MFDAATAGMDDERRALPLPLPLPFTMLSRPWEMPQAFARRAEGLALQAARWSATLPAMPGMTIEQALSLAIAHHQAGRLAEAEALYRQIIEVQPEHADALNLLGLVAYHTGRGSVAVEIILKAIALKPASAMYHQNLGLVLTALGKTREAISTLREALRLQPDYAIASDNLGWALVTEGCLVEAVAIFRQTLNMDPRFALAHSHLGIALSFLGQFDEALSHFQKSVELEPVTTRIRDNYLCFLHYNPQTTLAGLLNAHVEYEHHLAAPLPTHSHPQIVEQDLRRPLRVGFVSPHFASHPVGSFIVGLLENLDLNFIKPVCYSDTLSADRMTERIKAVVAWNDVSAMNDEQLAARIREDRIDILFDLAGHTPGNRLLAFARKPAPIQVTWLDYVGTTGLATMDYILADPRQIPPGSECWYSETVLRMPDDYICFDPPPGSPPVGPLPAQAAGHVTFGSLNVLCKTTPQMLAIWAQILHRVPRSRLILKSMGLGDAPTASRYLEVFESHGIPAERLELQGRSPSDQVIATYNRVDIALDTHPYNGGLTTCEALWMGVPVVTLPGESFASRHGLAHLTAAGMPETIAANPGHYVEIAVQLASDIAKLAKLRARLRERTAISPLCNGKRFAAHFSNLMHEIWRRRANPQSADVGN